MIKAPRPGEIWCYLNHFSCRIIKVTYRGLVRFKVIETQSHLFRTGEICHESLGIFKNRYAPVYQFVS